MKVMKVKSKCKYYKKPNIESRITLRSHLPNRYTGILHMISSVARFKAPIICDIVNKCIKT